LILRQADLSHISYHHIIY